MTDLSFQKRVQPQPPLRFRSFYGRNIDQMPLLLSGKDEKGNVVDVPRVPMTPKQLLYERVHGGNKHDTKLLRDNYVDTACAVIGDPSGTREVLIELYTNPVVRELIHALNPESTLHLGSLQLNPDQYHAIKENGAFALSSATAGNLRESAYSEQKTREAFWEYVTDGDKQLVKDTLELYKGTLENRMGLYVPSVQGLRLLFVGSVDGNNSNADGSSSLNDSIGRLVGVAMGDKTPEGRAHDNDLTNRVQQGFSEAAVKELLTQHIGFTDARAEEYFRKLRER